MVILLLKNRVDGMNGPFLKTGIYRSLCMPVIGKSMFEGYDL